MYRVSLWLHPFTLCRRCGGSGITAGFLPWSRAFCRKCDGRGLVPRLGTMTALLRGTVPAMMAGFSGTGGPDYRPRSPRDIRWLPRGCRHPERPGLPGQPWPPGAGAARRAGSQATAVPPSRAVTCAASGRRAADRRPGPSCHHGNRRTTPAPAGRAGRHGRAGRTAGLTPRRDPAWTPPPGTREPARPRPRSRAAVRSVRLRSLRKRS